jgi:outer membrane protein OmpA-like peptidoglycan-associated protein/tetratricopeptide (TPR) repeat protein
MQKWGLFFVFFFTLYACTYTEKIRDGKTAFERKQFTVANEFLQNEIKKVKTGTDRGILSFFLAETAMQLGNIEQAIENYRIAYDNGFGVDALKGLAFALKQGEFYTEAMQTFKDLSIEIGSPYEYRKDIIHCELAAQWKKEEYKDFKVELLPVNSPYADYSPILLDKNHLIFTSDRPTATGEQTYLWTGAGYSDVFIADLETGDASPWKVNINTNAHEGTLSFNAERSKAVFTRCIGGKREDAYCKLFLIEKTNADSWGTAMPVFPELKELNLGHPTLSEDGKYMILSAKAPEGWGGYDLYSSQLLENGTWSEPTLLNRQINTPGNEQFPSLDKDTLYFSSDFHPGMGGLDIFKSFRMENGEWSPPVNLKHPINSGADDFNYTIIHSLNNLPYGYFTSTRQGGDGREDIYTFKKLPPNLKKEEKQPLSKPAALAFQYFLDVYVVEKIFAEPNNPNTTLLGRKPLANATLSTTITGSEQAFKTDSTGKIRITIQPGTTWQFVAGKDGYLNNSASFNAAGLQASPENPVQIVEMEIVLDKVFKNTEIVLSDIYYDLDKWDIRTDAKPTLDKLSNTLILNPLIRIQLGSHTDCRGNDTYNQVLSQRRAQSAIEYLIGKGVPPGRMVAKGFGETAPTALCICSRCTEDEHQKNRRTTFKIID